MRLLKSKSAKLSTGIINTAILVIVLLVVLFQIYAAVVPEAQSAGDLMNVSNRCEAVGCHFNASLTPNCVLNSSTNQSDIVGCANNANSIPLGSLFSAGGVVFVIIMASVIVLVVKTFMKGGK